MIFKSNQDLIDTMLNFEKLFDIVRIIDPVLKKVVEYKDYSEVAYTSVCYKYWKKGVPCSNCISIRAMNENDTFVKIEVTVQS